MFSGWAVSENYVVIIGASIPTLSPLRAMGKRSTTAQQSYQMYGSSRSGRGRLSKRTGLDRSISGAQEPINHPGLTSPSDLTTSQEHILTPQDSDIIKTVVYDVSYSNSAKNDSA